MQKNIIQVSITQKMNNKSTNIEYGDLPKTCKDQITNKSIDIITNIRYLNGGYIKLNLPETNEPRILMKTQVARLMLEFPDKMIVIAIRFIGRRVMQNNAKMIDLLDNRRHRIYYGIGYGKKIHIKFTWHKLKHFSALERKFLCENFHDDIFETPNIKESAQFLITQTGGAPLANLIYRYNPNYYFKK